jgi:16S rRNA G966 N2-methylase RsmD
MITTYVNTSILCVSITFCESFESSRKILKCLQVTSPEDASGGQRHLKVEVHEWGSGIGGKVYFLYARRICGEEGLGRHRLSASLLAFAVARLRAAEVYCMTCCTGPCAAASHFDPRKADRDLRRYQRRGPDGTTRMLLSELRRWPLQGLHLLDVGGGIGVIAVELAGAGLASVTLADASAGYLEAARRHLASRDASLPAQFILGDFAITANCLPDADIVTLDRVVCCYPDVEALLRGAAARARRMIAFTYPRYRWGVRAALVVENSWYWLRQDPFRAFVHSPERMASVLEAAGFVRAARQATIGWALDLYRRRV